jgi:hypothetical protein
MFDEAFLNSIPSNPYEAIYAMCLKFSEVNKGIPEVEEVANFDKYIEAYAAVETFMTITGLPYSMMGINGSTKN